MAQVLVTTIPFGTHNRKPLDLLDSLGVTYEINPLGRRLTVAELAELVGDAEVIIAGTEPITAEVMEAGRNLKLVARVGVGLDNVDLIAARERGLRVTYTPQAPAAAVAELTIGLFLSLLRGIHTANLSLHEGRWDRIMGRRLSEVTIGIIGTGRIGSQVLRGLTGFGCPRILVNDLNPRPDLVPELELEWVDKETIYKQADVISLHLPMTRETRNMIRRSHLLTMKKGALLVNTARGGIINEADLADVLESGHLGGAAIDVFANEPYAGPLADLDRTLLTCHMGSMSVDCRSRMEIEATEEVVRHYRAEPLNNLVPGEEYEEQERR